MKKSIKENRPRGLAICCLPGRSFLEQSTSMATLLPIDKVIGRLYPLFGAVLLTMAFGIGGAIFFGGYTLPEMSLTNLHPEGLPIWPYMFVTVACGAISGFHATQSPMVAKCITSEKEGRRVFYGAMLKESMIALV